MKSYLGLIPLSAKVRRRQNRMTVLCILIAVLLVTAIFSMADMAIRMETARVIDSHGYWHAMLQSLPEETADAITAEPEVKASARYDGLNFTLSEDYTMDGKPCVVVGGDEAILTEIYDDLAEGHFPQTPDEILLSRRAKTMLSVEVGDKVTLHTPAGAFVYTISGFGADVTISTDASVVGAVLNWDAFASLADAEGETTAPVWFVRLDEHANARKVLDRWRQQYGLTDETLSENTALLGLTGFSSDSYVLGMYLVAAILFVLVLAAGVFMIAGSLNSQTAQRTQFYGMLRCIGASKAQIMRLVRWEALYWCKTAVPLGVGLGILTTWGLCALLRFGAGAEFVQIPLFAVSPVGIVSGVVVGGLTVLLSSRAPARRAAGVSPVAAVSGNDAKGSRAGRPMRRTGRRVEVTLGIHHAVESPKNLLLMTGSFALSILLILAFSVMVQWVQLALNPLQPWAPDVFYSSPANACEIPRDFAEEVAAQPGVKRAFGRMYASLEASYQGKTGTIDLISYEDQQFHWAEDTLTAGDLDAVRAGEGVLTVFDKSNSLQVGDTIQIGDTALPVLGVLEDSPFSADDHPTVICSEALFEELTGQSGYAVLDVQLTADATRETVTELQALAGNYDFYDRLDLNRDTRNTYWMFCLFVYGFLAIITLITMIHTVNSISLSVAARTRQYGAMRAVGMAAAQLKTMIFAEAATYTVLGFGVGCGLGLPLHAFLYNQMITHYWGVAWQLPLGTIGGIVALLVFTSLAAPFAPARRVCSLPVAGSINEL